MSDGSFCLRRMPILGEVTLPIIASAISSSITGSVDELFGRCLLLRQLLPKILFLKVQVRTVTGWVDKRIRTSVF